MNPLPDPQLIRIIHQMDRAVDRWETDLPLTPYRLAKGLGKPA